jgi:hypothetical protein
MFLNIRPLLVRNFAVSAVNGSLTLVILLIAPLGLAAVITNTVLVVAATLVSSAFVDGVVRFLEAGEIERLRFSDPPPESGEIRRSENTDLRGF